MSRAATTAAVVIAAVLVVVFWRLAGPAPLPVNAPAREFSAERSIAVLHELMPEGVPHPVGSAANQRIRERIAARLRQLGYPVVIQRKFVCNGRPSCATVENIIAVPPGSGDVVLLTAHYDSVPAGPGVSDDGTAVAAILEIARALRSDQRARNRVGILITDGEEAGLLGAEAFVSEEALTRDIAVVINIESRGPSGPSFLFETSANNAQLIAHASRALRHPITSSLFFTVYDKLPNDTDVTVFKRAGLQSVNFASVGDVGVYHTPLDDFEHIDRRTVQHHGSNVLSLARELASADLRRTSRGNATYFDILGFDVVAWPERWNLWIALWLAVALLPALQSGTFGRVIAAIAISVAGIVASGCIGALLMFAFRPRIASAPYLVAAAALAGGALMGASSLLIPRRFARLDLILGATIVWVALAIICAALLPGASFLFIVPAAAMVIRSYLQRRTIVGTMLPTLAASVLLLPLIVLLYGALGSLSFIAIAILAALITTAFAPELRKETLLAMGALAVLLTVRGALSPRHDARLPVTRNLSYVLDANAHHAWWGTGSGRRPAAVLGLPPVLARQEGPMLEVSSRRGGDALLVEIPRDVKVVSVNGVAPAPPTRRMPKLAVASIIVRGREARIELRGGRRPLRVTVSDVSWGVPREGTALVQQRYGSGAVPIQAGDVTITRREIALK